MPLETQVTVDRRSFLKLAGASGLGLAIGYVAHPTLRGWKRSPSNPWLWVRLESQSLVEQGSATIVLPRCEMGQGTMTGLAMLVADELDLDWNQVRTEWAPPLAPYATDEYSHLSTTSSDAIHRLWKPLRETSAVLRHLLLSAAARQWQVEMAECRTARSTVIHQPTGRTRTYGSLLNAAQAIPIPNRVPLKSAQQYTLIGRSLPRLDSRAKSTGAAIYGIDVQLPDLLMAAIVHCPVRGGKLAAWHPDAVKSRSGVRDVVGISSEGIDGWTAVAVVADSYWTAQQAVKELDLTWDLGDNTTWNDERVAARFHELSEQRMRRLVSRGNAVKQCHSVSEPRHRAATFTAPFLAHATQEPMNCTAYVSGNQCEVWVGTQKPDEARDVAAKAAGVPRDNVTIHQTFLGGGFGRRQDSEFIAEAIQIARAVHAPVKLIWSREEDLQHGTYRPASLHRLEAVVDDDGYPLAWWHRIIGAGSRTQLAQGVEEVPYQIEHVQIELAREWGIPLRIGPWRGVARAHNTFVTECFLDEIARAHAHDPLAIRLHLLRDATRYCRVLELLRDKSNWGQPSIAGTHQGIAVGEHFGTICAQVAEVSITDARRVQVHRVVCVVDCGRVINPDSVIQQMEGGIIYGLSAALHGEITLAEGRVEQSNFHDYRMARMSETPVIEVHLVESDEDPLGVGEVAVPPLAPAVANAVARATGQSIRSLPIRLA